VLGSYIDLILAWLLGDSYTTSEVVFLCSCFLLVFIGLFGGKKR